MEKETAPIKMRKLKDFSDTSGKRFKLLLTCGILLAHCLVPCHAV